MSGRQRGKGRGFSWSFARENERRTQPSKRALEQARERRTGKRSRFFLLGCPVGGDGFVHVVFLFPFIFYLFLHYFLMMKSYESRETKSILSASCADCNKTLELSANCPTGRCSDERHEITSSACNSWSRKHLTRSCNRRNAQTSLRIVPVLQDVLKGVSRCRRGQPPCMWQDIATHSISVASSEHASTSPIFHFQAPKTSIKAQKNTTQDILGETAMRRGTAKL